MDKTICLMLAALVGMAPLPTVAGQLVAMVEAVEGGQPEVEELEPLEEGQILALASRDRIVLGYLDSCARETIAGPGIVRIGASVSTLEGASLIERRTVDCRGTALAGLGSGNGAAMRVRSIRPLGAPERSEAAQAERALVAMRAMRDRQTPGTASHRFPVLVLADPEQQVLLQPLEGQDKARRLRATTALVDTQGGTDPLEPGLWLARRGEAALMFMVTHDAGRSPAPRSDRLVRF